MDEVSNFYPNSDHRCEENSLNYPPFTPRKFSSVCEWCRHEPCLKEPRWHSVWPRAISLPSSRDAPPQPSDHSSTGDLAAFFGLWPPFRRYNPTASVWWRSHLLGIERLCLLSRVLHSSILFTSSKPLTCMVQF